MNQRGGGMTAEQKKAMLMSGQGRESTAEFRNKVRVDQINQHKQAAEADRRKSEAREAKEAITSNLWRGKQPEGSGKGARPKTAPATRNQDLPPFRRRADQQQVGKPVGDLVTQAQFKERDTDLFLNTLGLNNVTKASPAPTQPPPAAEPPKQRLPRKGTPPPAKRNEAPAVANTTGARRPRAAEPKKGMSVSLNAMSAACADHPWD